MAPHHWSIDALVRADEDSMFVRGDKLVGAVLGDIVEVTSDDPQVTRRGDSHSRYSPFSGGLASTNAG